MYWNICGLGHLDKCTIVHKTIQAANPLVVCLQERKLQDVSSFKEKTFLPLLNMFSSFSFVTLSGSQGGI
jgi:exonuclease III